MGSRLPGKIAGAPTRAPTLAGERNFHLDAVRALAAAVVVFDHSRSVFLKPFAEYKNVPHSPLVNLIYTDHYFARAAVMLFFLLSGYLVGTSALRSEAGNGFSWGSYLLSRLSRLWVVLIPALLLTAVVDHFGILHAPPHSVTMAEAVAQRSWPNFLGTLVFLQKIFVQPFGSNGAAWSLAYEFWYYILFPCLALAFLSPERRWRNALLALAVIALCWGEILTRFPIWCAGVLVGAAARRWPLSSSTSRLLTVAASLGVLVLAVLAAAAHRLGEVSADYAIMVPSFTLLWALLCMPPTRIGIYAKTAIFFSEMSYTLYLTHQPIVTSLSALWLRDRRWPADPPHLLLLLCIPIAFSFLCAYVFYVAFESRTGNVRRWLRNHLPASAA